MLNERLRQDIYRLNPQIPAADRGSELGLNDDELAFYEELANNEKSLLTLGDETQKKIAHELTESLRKNVSVDWAKRESVPSRLHIMVKGNLLKCKYP